MSIQREVLEQLAQTSNEMSEVQLETQNNVNKVRDRFIFICFRSSG